MNDSTNTAGFDTAHAAVRLTLERAYMVHRAFGRAMIRFHSEDAEINFNISNYEDDIRQMKILSKEKFVHILRQQCTSSHGGAPSTEASPFTNTVDGRLTWASSSTRSHHTIHQIANK